MSETLKRTSLFKTHVRLGAKMVPFGGYEMPVWYSSVLEEHTAVRQAAGLFDVSHMGVWEARGPNAALFMDAITSNDVFDIQIGGSQYGYLLDHDGDVIDDIMIYRVEAERYLIVVNASNDEKDWAWVTGDVERETTGRGARLRLPKCELRDLRAESSGPDRRVDIALQGPAALPTLARLLLPSNRLDVTNLQMLPRTGVMPATLVSVDSAIDVFISRTGYTGESIAYELFVHPDQAAALWAAILAAGADRGVKPCGLAARDSLRTEAGLPLYGHELAGPLNLAPFHIGFGGYAKLYKPFFVGKRAYFEKAAKATQKLSRFRFAKKGVRPPKQGAVVVNANGAAIGTVTSCVQDSEGFLMGLAMIDIAYGAKDGTPIFFAKPARAGVDTAAPPLDEATVLTRFPKKR